MATTSRNIDSRDEADDNRKQKWGWSGVAMKGKRMMNRWTDGQPVITESRGGGEMEWR
jgi:hypothetical protein